jgi:hypothetical protein
MWMQTSIIAHLADSLYSETSCVLIILGVYGFIRVMTLHVHGLLCFC